MKEAYVAIDEEKLNELAWKLYPHSHHHTDYGEEDYNEESREAFKEGYRYRAMED